MAGASKESGRRRILESLPPDHPHRDTAVKVSQTEPRPVREAFSHFSRRAADLAGGPWTFAVALSLIALWAVSGPIFGFSDTWQLIVNTSTTIVTFLMVFLLQHAQNKDTAVVHLKLDELIAATRGASNALIDLEDMDDAEIARLRLAYQVLADEAASKDRQGTTSIEDVAPPPGEAPRRGSGRPS